MNDTTNNFLYEILQELRRGRVGDELWTLHDICHYTQLSRATLQQRVLPKADFPKPQVIRTTEKGGAKRWLKSEVIKYFKQPQNEE